MTEPQEWIIRGAQLNGLAYLVLVVVAALVTNNPLAWKLGLLALGLTYLSYYAQIVFTNNVVVPLVLVATSIAIGVAAGIALLVR